MPLAERFKLFKLTFKINNERLCKFYINDLRTKIQAAAAPAAAAAAAAPPPTATGTTTTTTTC